MKARELKNFDVIQYKYYPGNTEDKICLLRIVFGGNLYNVNGSCLNEIDESELDKDVKNFTPEIEKVYRPKLKTLDLKELVDSSNLIKIYNSNGDLVFKDFLEENGVDWGSFLDNCKTENQRWPTKGYYYESINELKQEKPAFWIGDAFNLDYPICGEYNYRNLNEKWKIKVEEAEDLCVNIKFE